MAYQLKIKKISGDIEIKIIGLRSGEKLYEELIINGEAEKTSNKDFYCQRKITELCKIKVNLDLLEKALFENNEDDVLKISSQLVPEWTGNKYF